MFGLATFSGAPSSALSEVVGVAYACNISDTAVGSDVVSSLAILNGTISELATGADAVDTLAVLNSALSELATGADAILCAFLWNLIDDTQTPGWQSITANTDPGWAEVTGNTPTNWQDI